MHACIASRHFMGDNSRTVGDNLFKRTGDKNLYAWLVSGRMILEPWQVKVSSILQHNFPGT